MWLCILSAGSAHLWVQYVNKTILTFFSHCHHTTYSVNIIQRGKFLRNEAHYDSPILPEVADTMWAKEQIDPFVLHLHAAWRNLFQYSHFCAICILFIWSLDTFRVVSGLKGLWSEDDMSDLNCELEKSNFFWFERKQNSCSVPACSEPSRTKLLSGFENLVKDLISKFEFLIKQQLLPCATWQPLCIGTSLCWFTSPRYIGVTACISAVLHFFMLATGIKIQLIWSIIQHDGGYNSWDDPISMQVWTTKQFFMVDICSKYNSSDLQCFNQIAVCFFKSLRFNIFHPGQ